MQSQINVQLLKSKANAHALTDADMVSIKSAGLVVKHKIGTSLNDVLARQAKRRFKPCDCSAYAFPHRLDSGKCREQYNNQTVEPIGNSYLRAMDDAGHKESDFI